MEKRGLLRGVEIASRFSSRSTLRIIRSHSSPRADCQKHIGPVDRDLCAVLTHQTKATCVEAPWMVLCHRLHRRSSRWSLQHQWPTDCYFCDTLPLACRAIYRDNARVLFTDRSPHCDRTWSVWKVDHGDLSILFVVDARSCSGHPAGKSNAAMDQTWRLRQYHLHLFARDGQHPRFWIDPESTWGGNPNQRPIAYCSQEQ